jgi:hypothetical protein
MNVNVEVKGGRRVGLITIAPSCDDCIEILEASMVAPLVEALRYKPEGRGFDSLRFFID